MQEATTNMHETIFGSVRFSMSSLTKCLETVGEHSTRWHVNDGVEHKQEGQRIV